MPRLPTGLQLRGNRWTYEVRHERLRGGRMSISLRCSEDQLDLAIRRRAAIVTLMERGDWRIIERLRQGEIHITDIARAVREGDVPSLHRVGHSPTRLGDAAERFMRRTRGSKTRAATISAYQSSVNVLIEELGEDFPMHELTREQAERVLHAPKETTGGEPWAPNTQRGHRETWAALWNLAIEDEAERALRLDLDPVLVDNPWKRAEVPTVEKTRNVFLLPEEWRAVAEANADLPELALLACAFLAGLRQSEIRHLRRDVDVQINGAEPVLDIQPREGEWPWRPKERRSVRTVPVIPELRRILERHIELGFAGDRYLIRAAGKDQPIGRATSASWTERAYERAGIRYGRDDGDGATLHTGRHTFASWLAQGDPDRDIEPASLHVIAALLGNTVKMVESTYAHLVPDTRRSAAMKIEGRLR